MMHDTLAAALSSMKNAEKRAKSEVIVKPISKITIEVLKILEKEGYIAGFEKVEDTRGGEIKIKLNGMINNIGAIKPRYPAQVAEFEKFETRYLPAKDFGKLIVSTSKGNMTNIEAKEKKIGGVLLAYVY